MSAVDEQAGANDQGISPEDPVGALQMSEILKGRLKGDEWKLLKLWEF